MTPDIDLQQVNWADEREHAIPMTAPPRAPNTIDLEMDAGGITLEYIEVKEETDIITDPAPHDPLRPEAEITLTAPTTSPKRSKKLKTGRETPYQHGRTRSKTRGSKPLYTTMSQ